MLEAVGTATNKSIPFRGNSFGVSNSHIRNARLKLLSLRYFNLNRWQAFLPFGIANIYKETKMREHLLCPCLALFVSGQVCASVLSVAGQVSGMGSATFPGTLYSANPSTFLLDMTYEPSTDATAILSAARLSVTCDYGGGLPTTWLFESIRQTPLVSWGNYQTGGQITVSQSISGESAISIAVAFDGGTINALAMYFNMTIFCPSAGLTSSVASAGNIESVFASRTSSSGTFHDYFPQIDHTTPIFATPVPAPGVLALLCLAGLPGARRRRRSCA